MISEETRNKWKSKLNHILKHQDKLNEWEIGFIDSIDILLSKNEDISFKQSSILSRIYIKVE
jgi:hypothetical protein